MARTKSRKQSLQRRTEFTAAAAYSGPLPQPSDFGHYEVILPGAAERILAMAENQAKHRQELEKKAITAEIRRSGLGQIFGFILGLAGLSGSVYAVVIGAGWPGVAIGGASLASLVSVFIYGARERRKEREDKTLMQLQ